MGPDPGTRALQILSAKLLEAGNGGLKRELQAAIRDAAQPIAREIRNPAHLRAYMPARYADLLSGEDGRSGDLEVTTHAITVGPDAGITVLARAPTVGRGGRKIRQRNAGLITHPLFGDRQRWFTQSDGMRPRFFDDPAESSAPQVRDAILTAMKDTTDKITRKA